MTDDRAAFTEAREAGLAIRQQRRIETREELRHRTRREVAEEIAAKCLRRAQLAERVPEGERSGVREGMVLTWLEAERLAREIGTKDAS